MEIEIPEWLYKLLLNEAAETELPVEEIVECTIKSYIERNDDIVD